MIFLVVVSGVLGVVVSYYQARRITNPIQRLAEASMAVAAGEENQYVHFDKHDEISRLAKAFNYILNPAILF